MKHKSYYRFIALLLSAVLCVNIVHEKTIKSHAIAPAIPIIWEILQTLLLSAGVTYMGYEAIQHVKETMSYQDNIDDILASLDGLSPGLGAEIDTALDGTQTDSRGRSVATIPQETWNKLLSASKSIAEQGTYDMGGYASSIQTQVLADVISAAVGRIADNYLPVGKDGVQVRSTFVSDVYNSWNEFLTYAKQLSGSDNPNISAFYTSTGFAETDKWEIIIAFTEGNVPVKSYRLTRSDGTAPQGAQASPYLELLDANGTAIPWGGIRATWDQYNNQWSMVTGRTSSDWPVYNQVKVRQKVISITYEKHAYDQSLFGNSAITVPNPVNIDTQVKPSVIGGTYDVVTPGRTQTQSGTLEGDVTITLPKDIAITDTFPAIIDGTKPIVDVLPQVGVIPVDTTQDIAIGKDETISDAIAGVGAIDVPGVDGFNLNLAEFFPFCIPFDFADFLGLLKAEPTAPTFTFIMPTGMSSNGDIQYTEYTLSLAQFDEVAFWCRQFELLAFIIGLIMLTRSMFVRS